jgi:hypothetical protein
VINQLRTMIISRDVPPGEQVRQEEMARVLVPANIQPLRAENLKQEPADPPTILLHHRYRALCRQKYRTATY